MTDFANLGENFKERFGISSVMKDNLFLTVAIHHMMNRAFIFYSLRVGRGAWGIMMQER